MGLPLWLGTAADAGVDWAAAVRTPGSYRWLYMITKAFVDYNGVVVEKYDVTRPIDPHRVDAEYGRGWDAGR